MLKRKTNFSRLASALASVLAFAAIAQADDLPPIFNGKDLTGWKVPATNLFWKVVDGVIVGENDAAKVAGMGLSGGRSCVILPT